VLEALGREASLSSIYEEVDGHKKTESNPHWKEKVRQTLQLLEKAGLAKPLERGVWAVA